MMVFQPGFIMSSSFSVQSISPQQNACSQIPPRSARCFAFGKRAESCARPWTYSTSSLEILNPIDKAVRANVSQPTALAFARRKFAQPIVTQTRSPFVGLPAELRIKVLRNLMSANSAIDTKDQLLRARETEEEYLTITSLSGQVLRCCQQLFNDGVHILYGENTIEIACVRSARLGMCCEILSGRIPLPTNLKELESASLGAFGWKETITAKLSPPTQFDWHSKYDPSYLGKMRAEWASFSQNLPALLNFRRLFVTMSISKAEQFFVACRVLRSVLQGRSMEINTQDATNEGMFLQSCCVWDCGSVEHAERDWLIDDLRFAGDADTCWRDTLPLLTAVDSLVTDQPLFPPQYPVQHDNLKEFVVAYEYESTLETAFEILRDVGDQLCQKRDHRNQRLNDIKKNFADWKSKLCEVVREDEDALTAFTRTKIVLDAAMRDMSSVKDSPLDEQGVWHVEVIRSIEYFQVECQELQDALTGGTEKEVVASPVPPHFVDDDEAPRQINAAV